MRRWLGVAAALYPRSWREEFGDEFNSLLDEMNPSWRVFTDVLRGAIRVRMTNSNSWMKIAAATAVAGAIVALGLSFRVTPPYEATATIRITPQADPLRPTTPEVLEERLNENIVRIQTELLSRAGLWSILKDSRNLLYQEEQKTRSLEDIIDEMRRHIRIQRRTAVETGMAPVTLDISFTYADPELAQKAVRALAVKWVLATENTNRRRDAAYRSLWGDMSHTGLTQTTPPPPPAREIAEVIETATTAKEIGGHYHFAFLAFGFGMGTLSGLLAAFALRWPGRTRVLGGFAVAGFVVAAAMSYLLPNRYVSTATMMISPAQLTEDPLAPPPAVTPAADYLRRVMPDVLSFQSIANIIQDPRLDLYRSERTATPLQEVAREMVKDVRIEPLKPGVDGQASAFQISFSYSDRFKAQQTVTALMARFEKLESERSRANQAQISLVGRAITERREGQVLDVVDNGSLPIRPVWPYRLMIASMGLCLGLMLGAIRLYRGGRGTPSTISVPNKESGSNESGLLPPSSNQFLTSEPSLL